MLDGGHLRMGSARGPPRIPCPRASSRQYRIGVASRDERHYSCDPRARGTQGVAWQQVKSTLYPSLAPNPVIAAL